MARRRPPFGTQREGAIDAERPDSTAGDGVHAASDVLASVLEDAHDAAWSPRDVVRVKRLAHGLTYTVFRATLERPDGSVGSLVVRLPYAGAPVRDTCDDVLGGAAQAALLAQLATLALPLRLPRALGTRRTRHGTAIVETFVDGVPVDLRAGRSMERPWEFVAEAAAACHRADPRGVSGLVPTFATRRDHAAAAVRRAAALDVPVAADFAAWAADRLPPPAPARLLHGDLLGQNVLVRVFCDADRDHEPRLGVVDWQRTLIGDPAYDLAIVTRGAAHPFQAHGGMQLLLDAYAARAAEPVLPAEVRLYEAILLTLQCADAARGFGLESPHARQARECLLRCLDRWA